MSLDEESPSRPAAASGWEAIVGWSGSEPELQAVLLRLEVRLRREHGQLHISLPELDLETDPGAVDSAARGFIRRLNGVLVLQHFVGSFDYRSIIRNSPCGKSTQYLFASGVAQIGVSVYMSVEVYDKDGNLIPEEPPKPAPLPVGVSSEVDDLLGFVADLKQDDWGTLYKIAERIICSDAPLDDWGVRKPLEKIKRIASSPKTIGPLARHAVLKGDQPADKMTFHEAKALALAASQRWIEFQARGST